ncbi:unnamed protein product, partial [Arabidopsis lyrata]
TLAAGELVSEFRRQFSAIGDNYNRVWVIKSDNAVSEQEDTIFLLRDREIVLQDEALLQIQDESCLYSASSCHFSQSTEELRHPPPSNRHETA